MHAVPTPEPDQLSCQPATMVAAAPRRSAPARWDSHSLTPTVVVVSAHGDIDASNAGELMDYTRAHATTLQGLILDLRGVNFLGIEGFSTLHKISVCCAHTGTGWALVPGAATSRVLRLCDPDHGLPVSTVETALALFGEQPQRPPPLAAIGA